MKTMANLKVGILVLGAAGLLALAPVYGQPVAPAPQAKPAPAGSDVTGGSAMFPGGPLNRANGAAASGKEDIRDIRGPWEIADPWRWAMYAAVAASLAVLLCGVWWFCGRRKLRVVLAHERALEALERARKLMQPEHAREFSFQVSDVVRRYIEERFSLPTTQQTTAEFLLYMSQQDSGPLAGQRGLLNDFLEGCDLAKFARWELAQGEMEVMFQSARQFVEATRPDPSESRPRRKSLSWRRPADGPSAMQRPNLMVGGVS